jgi:methanogenic corrinoid protein MtbC1
MWESRYNALKPSRSTGNTRYYDGDQLRRLLNIVSLMDGGYKVSELCAMRDEEHFKLIENKKSLINDGLANYFVAQLIAAGINYEEASFNSLFAHCLLRFGMKESYTRVIFPLLLQTGILWSCNELSPAHEHFISNLIRQKMSTAIDLLPPASERETWVLFLRENEFHECGLLLAHYMLKQAGKKVIYLGANLPAPALISAMGSIKPDNLLSFFVHSELTAKNQSYIQSINKAFKGRMFYIASQTGTANGIKAKKVGWLHTIDDFVQLLQ